MTSKQKKIKKELAYLKTKSLEQLNIIKKEATSLIKDLEKRSKKIKEAQTKALAKPKKETPKKEEDVEESKVEVGE